MARLPRIEQPPEQLRYARWLELGTRVGLALLVISFFSYVLGWLPSQVAPQQLSELWSLPVADYLKAAGAHSGWGWLQDLGKGDVLAIIGIVVLAACSLPPLLALVPLYLKRGDRVYAALCLAEVAVIVLAASGLLSGGH